MCDLTQRFPTGVPVERGQASVRRSVRVQKRLPDDGSQP